jgi:GT2 family glycosyltransferase
MTGAAAWQAIVLSWNGREDTLRCLESLTQASAPGGLGIVCVDNGSADGSVEAVRERFPSVTVIENGANLGYSGGNNVGIRHALAAGAEWVVLVNNDAVVAPDFAEGFQRVAGEHPGAGILCGKLFFEDRPDRIWFAGQRFSTLLGYSGRPRGNGRLDGPRYQRVEPVDRAVGALMAISRAAIDAVGVLDEELFAYVEDVDLSLRVRDAGFEVLFAPGARAWHRVSGATGGDRASTHTSYYGVRNTIVVVERWRPLRAVGTALRRAVVVGTFGLHALTRSNPRASLRAVLEGYSDVRRGRLGPRRAAGS